MFLIPFTLTGFALIFFAIPKIDPLKENIEEFRRYYDGFVVLFLLYMLLFHFQIILWNIRIEISPNETLPIMLGILFFYVGVLCEKAKRNWFIGIRTPWTLSSERVWEKTHRIGGKLFKIAGVISFAGVLFQSYSLLFILVPVFSVAAYTIVYSYVEYRKEERVRRGLGRINAKH